MNSWCKVENGQVVDGPRAWADNTPPDDTWLPHRVEDPAHTVNDNFLGSHHEIRDGEVVEVNDYAAKSSQQIAEEVNGIKSMAAQEVAYADSMLSSQDLENREEWDAFKLAWSKLLNINELSWDYVMPRRPE